MIDIDVLLQDVDEVSPCGENLEYDAAFIALETQIGGRPEDPFSDQPAQPPKWDEIRRQALNLLGKTRDLRILIYLLRALIQTDGYEGLRSGLSLIRGSLQKFWEGLYPQLDPDDGNDPTQRVNILLELCDLEAFLRPIALIPLVESRAVGRFNLRDFQLVTERIVPPKDAEKLDLGTVKAAFRDANPDELQSRRLRLIESMEILTSIEDFVTDQVGVRNAPNLAAIRNLLKEGAYLFDELAAASGIRPEGQEAAGVAEGDGLGASLPSQRPAVPDASPGAIGNRRDVIKALDRICSYYTEYEPSSPVPILLMRAKRLVDMGFMDIIRDMAPDGLAQAELIRGPDPEGESEND